MRSIRNQMLILAVALIASTALAHEDVREPEGEFDSRTYAKVAVIQFSPPGHAPVDVPQSTVDRYKQSTIASLDSQIREAKENGAELVVTPEFSTVGYPDIPDLPDEEDEFQNREQIKPYTEHVDGPTSKHYSSLAKELRVWLIVGIAEVDNQKFYNTLLAFNDKGELVQTYRKVHLFEGEHNFLFAGSERKYFDSPFGRVGMFTCYDIHFDHPAGDVVTKDEAKIIAFSTSWVGEDGMATFKNFAREYDVYFLAANHVYFPDSGVVSPDGKTQSHIRYVNGPAYGYVPRATTSRTRRK